MARRKMRDMPRTCTPDTIIFTTKRGKLVEFRGRHGGTKKFGGKCAAKPPTSAQRAQRRAFAKAARSCHGRSLKARAACVRSKLK
jgi:hypothetical protein